jgi:hypothetical protein
VEKREDFLQPCQNTCVNQLKIDFRGNNCEKTFTEFHTFHQTESKKGMSTQKSNQLHEKRCKAKYVIVYRETGQVTMNFPWIHKSQDIQESCQFKHAIHRCFKKKKSVWSQNALTKWKSRRMHQQQAALRRLHNIRLNAEGCINKKSRLQH